MVIIVPAGHLYSSGGYGTHSQEALLALASATPASSSISVSDLAITTYTVTVGGIATKMDGR